MAEIGLESRLEGVVGGRTATALKRAFEMETVADLLWHFPRRYSGRGELTPLVGLPVGEHVTVLAQVLDVRERRMQRRGGSLLEVRITDGIGSLQLTFFNQSWRAAQLHAGVRGIFAGKVSEYRGHLQLQHPDYELFGQADGPGALIEKEGEAAAPVSPEQERRLDEAAAMAFAERPVPIYPATSTVASWTIERAVGLALDALGPVEDPIPQQVRQSAKIIPLGQSLELIHRPERAADWRRARDGMRFREAFQLQLALLDRRRRFGLAATTPRLARPGGLLDAFDGELPFRLTADQQNVAAEIAAELAQPHPMHRMLQGEVGSGKTVVALRAMLQVAENGGQSAMLAPTEVLASQHYRSIVEALGPKLAPELVPVLLTSKMPAAEKRRALLSIASGNARIVVGTHALLSENVSFYDLGLIVVDEQHRFGVEQREALRLKGIDDDEASGGPHLLAMTATPIPRTVALTAFGDLEVSTIRTLPVGRQGIQTFTVPIFERPKWAERAWLRALEEIAQGRQAYVVCPAIADGRREEGDPEANDADAGVSGGADGGGGAAKAPPASVEGTLAELRARPDYAGIRLAGLTGAMKPDDKDAVMRAFTAGEIGVLVATTVIEVGVNVPNASVMIVRDADRFGISQLHQLRGRVGRGEHSGLCLLLTAAAPGSAARERLDAVAATADGFELAEKDLELRREGDILGTAQSGARSTLKLLRVVDHGEIIDRAREIADALLQSDPELATAPLLAAHLADERLRLENLAKT